MTTAFLAACHSHPVALTARGPGQAPVGTYSPIDRFRAAFDLAYRSRDADIFGSGSPDAPTVPHVVLVGYDREYLEAGFSLVRANCEDYFEREGNLQQATNVFKDLGNSFLPIASGAVAIASSGGSAAGIIALVGAANNGVLNAVYKDFLFDSANIASVHDLVNAALTTNEAKVYANIQTAGTSISFDWVTRQILTEQNTCQPANILQLAQAAIATAKPTVANAAGETGSADVKGGTNPPVTANSPPPPSTLPAQVASGALVQTADDKKAVYEADVYERHVTTNGLIKDDPSKVALMECLFPRAVTFKGPMGYDAAGRPAPLDTKAHAAINRWLPTVGLKKESVSELLMAPDQGDFRKEAVRVNCASSEGN